VVEKKCSSDCKNFILFSNA